MKPPLVVENLRTLNRKERFYLVGHALGNRDFSPSLEFARSIRGAITDASIDYRTCHFSAMDYHIDWLYAALFATARGIHVADVASHEGPWPNHDHLVSAMQQNIDFVMVFADMNVQSTVHIVLVEAKGVGAWNSTQLRSKGQRLGAILREEALCKKSDTMLHFAYAAPAGNRPSEGQLQHCDILELMQNAEAFVDLPIPSPLVKVTRCDCDGHPSAEGKQWKFEIDRTA